MYNFIVTAGRAGSTFLAAELNLHEQAFCLMESHHLPLLIDAFGDEPATPAALLAVLGTAHFVSGPSIHDINLGKFNIPYQYWFDWTLDLKSRHQRMTVAAFQEAYESFWLEQTGKSTFIDKTPCYGMSLPEIGHALGELRLVHLTRDVLPSVKSMAGHSGFRTKLRSGYDSWTDVLRFENVGAIDADSPLTEAETKGMARLWAKRTGTPIRAAAASGMKLEILRYEDMMAQPEAFCHRLLEIFGLSHSEPWIAAFTKALQSSDRPASYDDEPAFQCLCDLPEIAEVRQLCGYGAAPQEAAPGRFSSIRARLRSLLR